MKKTLRCAALSVAMALTILASMFGGVDRASACESVDAYFTTLYSDDTYQTVVGYIYPVGCQQVPFLYVQYQLSGSIGRYSIDEYAYTCYSWECQP